MSTLQNRIWDIQRQIMALMNQRDNLQARHDRAETRKRVRAHFLPLVSPFYDA
jgi:hypothetical protein